MPSLSYETLTVLVLLALAGSLLGIASLLLAVRSLSARLLNVRQTYARLIEGGGEDEDLVAAVDRHLGHVERLSKATELLSTEVASLRQHVSTLVRTPGVVRYDAFDQPSGRQSFSTAFLNEAGDGVVLTALNTRSETRVYAKPVEGGSSDHNLSEEERLAIKAVLGGEPLAPAT